MEDNINNIRLMNFGYPQDSIPSQSVKYGNVEIANMGRGFTSKFYHNLKYQDFMKPVSLYPMGKSEKNDNHVEFADNPYNGNEIRIVDRWGRVQIVTYISIDNKVK